MKSVAGALVILLGIGVFHLYLSRSPAWAGGKLVDLIPGLYGGDGIFLGTDPAADHTAHFRVASAASLNRLNQQISAEIGVFPFSSSVGGFTFAFDPTLGTFLRTTETLGPLFAEKAQTLGRRKFNFNVSFTYFKYDKFEGESLDNLPVVARHDPDIIGFPDVREQFENDVIRINVDLDIRVYIVTLAATYGITDRLDLGILVPIVHVDMDVRTNAQVAPSSQNTLFPDVHFFDGAIENSTDTAHGEATGIGDIVLRAKYRLLEGDRLDLAGALLLKIATGDEDDFLGTGDTTIRPFLILSRTFDDFPLSKVNFTPHVNLGFEFNANRTHQHAIEYVVGFDVGNNRFVLAGELIGSHEPDGDGIGDTILTASVGIKWNPWKQLLLSANAQFPLNDDGLRSNLIMTFGLEYGI